MSRIAEIRKATEIERRQAAGLVGRSVRCVQDWERGINSEMERQMMRTKTKHIAIAAFVITIFAVASTLDYNDALREQRHYCDMIEAGHWPDFRDIKDTCKETNP